MRKVNAVVTAGILVLFVIHAVAGGLQLAGAAAGGVAWLTWLAWIMTGLIAAHMVISIKLTADTVSAQRKAGVYYFRENKLFWARRISGFAVFVFILLHIVLFLGRSEPAYRLNVFDGLQLCGQILLVISLAVHVISNVKPVLMAFGIKSFRDHAVDILFVVSAVLVFTGIAFIIYYARWTAV